MKRIGKGRTSLSTVRLRLRLGPVFFVLILIAALAAPPPAIQAVPSDTINVTTTDDEWDEGAGCSLREAIWAADTDLPFGGCPAGSGADIIELPAGTYTLTRPGVGSQNGDLDLHTEITINGAGQATTIVDGNGLDRVFHVQGENVVLNDLTVTGGRAPHGLAGTAPVFPGSDGGSGGDGASGGGIWNEGSLLMNRCTIRDNRAGNGGDASDGQPGINAPSPGGTGGAGGDGGWAGHGGDGGGIYSQGPLTLNDCTLEENRGGVGGGGGSGGRGGLGGAGQPGGVGGEGGAGRDGGEGGDGGAIRSEDTLEINDCILRNNRAGNAGVAGPGGDGGDGGAGNAGLIGGTGGVGGAGGKGGRGDEGGEGGAIYTYTPLTVRNSLVTQNRSGAGSQGAVGGAGGSGGDGGNGVGTGGNGGRGGAGGVGGEGGQGGNGGDAGGISATRTFSMTLSEVSLNQCGDGSPGAVGGQGGTGGEGGDKGPALGSPGFGGNGGTGGRGGYGGYGGNGGGIRGRSSANNPFALTDSVISGNEAGHGSDGGRGGRGGDAGQGGKEPYVPGTNGTGGNGNGGADGGNGGGVHISGGGPRVLIKNCTISGNTTGDGGQGGTGGDSGQGASLTTGNGGNGVDGGSGGAGGGLYLTNGRHGLLNCTISGNQTGSGGDGGYGGTGLDGEGTGGDGGYAGTGGGIYDLAVVGATSCTIAGNHASGAGGDGGEGSPDGDPGLGGRGGGVYDTDSFSMTHTILGDNTAAAAGPDCHHAIDSEDYNLIESVLDCPMTNPGHDIIGEDPDLLALADNGGSTETHLLEPDSPALDGGNTACTDHLGVPLTVDQRGAARPVDGDGAGGARCDIGAVEMQGEFGLEVVVTGGGSVDSDPAGIDCGSDCDQDYFEGTVVDLTATVGEGGRFDGWSGDCGGTDPVCTVTMLGDRSATAEFVFPVFLPLVQKE